MAAADRGPLALDRTLRCQGQVVATFDHGLHGTRGAKGGAETGDGRLNSVLVVSTAGQLREQARVEREALPDERSERCDIEQRDRPAVGMCTVLNWVLASASCMCQGLRCCGGGS